MIDRDSRRSLLAALDDYLSGTIMTFEFQDRLDAVRSKDRTVREIIFLSWFHYDDLIDHPVKLNRQQWNFFQRLRLIAQSEACIQAESHWNWSGFHSLLLIGILSLGFVACIARVGCTFWFIDFALGLVFALYMYARKEDWPSPSMIPFTEMVPFASFSSMRDVYESEPLFCKMPYPRTMDLTPLRSTFRLRLGAIPWLIFWPMLGLVALFTVRRSEYSVVPPNLRT